MSWLSNLVATPTCSVCGRNSSDRYLADGYICKDCIAMCSGYISPKNIRKATVEQVVVTIQEAVANDKRYQAFSPTRRVGEYLEIDENHRLWRSPKFSEGLIFRYEDIVSMQMLQDSDTVTTSHGGIGSAVAGGVMFGTAGAIIGHQAGQRQYSSSVTTKYGLQVITQNAFVPTIYISFMPAGDREIAAAQMVTSYLTQIKDQCARQQRYQELNQFAAANPRPVSVPTNQYSAADEIAKLKDLLDSGAITQEEYDAKKSQLLGM